MIFSLMIKNHSRNLIKDVILLRNLFLWVTRTSKLQPIPFGSYPESRTSRSELMKYYGICNHEKHQQHQNRYENGSKTAILSVDVIQQFKKGIFLPKKLFFHLTHFFECH